MQKHGFRRATFALSAVAVSLGLGLNSTHFAQQVGPKQQDAPLKTLTLNGKGGPLKLTTQIFARRPKALSAAQRASLFRGRVPKQSFTLSPEEPVFRPYIAWLWLTKAEDVYPYYNLVNFRADGRVVLAFEAKIGKLYALIFNVAVPHTVTAVFTIFNGDTNATQTTETTVDMPVTALVSAESTDLRFSLTCSHQWSFYSVEVTEL